MQFSHQRGSRRLILCQRWVLRTLPFNGTCEISCSNLSVAEYHFHITRLFAILTSNVLNWIWNLSIIKNHIYMAEMYCPFSTEFRLFMRTSLSSLLNAGESRVLVWFDLLKLQKVTLSEIFSHMVSLSLTWLCLWETLYIYDFKSLFQLQSLSEQ